MTTRHSRLYRPNKPAHAYTARRLADDDLASVKLVCQRETMPIVNPEGKTIIRPFPGSGQNSEPTVAYFATTACTDECGARGCARPGQRVEWYCRVCTRIHTTSAPERFRKATDVAAAEIK